MPWMAAVMDTSLNSWLAVMLAAPWCWWVTNWGGGLIDGGRPKGERTWLPWESGWERTKLAGRFHQVLPTLWAAYICTVKRCFALMLQRPNYGDLGNALAVGLNKNRVWEASSLKKHLLFSSDLDWRGGRELGSLLFPIHKTPKLSWPSIPPFLVVSISLQTK